MTKIIKYKTFLLVLLAGLFSMTLSNFSFAQKSVNASSITEEISLIDYFSMYIDNSKKMSIYAIASPDSEITFTQAPTQPNLGFSGAVIWLSTTIENNSSEDQRYFIRQNHTNTDYIDFYSNDGDDWQRLIAGDRIDFDQRLYNYTQAIFPLDIAANSNKTIYIRLQSKGDLIIDFGLNTPASLFIATSRDKIFLGVFFGGILSLFIYNSLRFMSAPCFITAYYLLYIFSMAVYKIIYEGFGFKFLSPSNTTFANNMVLFALIATNLCWLQFSRKVLSLSDISENADKVTRLLILFLLLLFLAIPLFDYAVISLAIGATTIFCLLYLLAMGGIALSAGYKPAKFYLAATSILFIGFALEILRSRGFISNNVVTQNVSSIAILIELTVLSLVLSINILEDTRYKFIDPSTYMYNRNYFFERLENEFDIALHQNHTLCLLLINIDDYNKSNIFSDYRNNRLVKRVAYQTEQILRKVHIACRFSQDELAIILPNTPTESAKIIGERVRLSIEDNCQTTASIGIASYNPNDKSNNISNHNELLETSDQAMYLALKNGGNRIEMYETSYGQNYQSRRVTDPS